MAGTFVHLTFSNRAANCAELLGPLREFTAKRMSLERVQRLEGNQPVFGQLPSEWAEASVTPSDLGLEDGEWYRDVVAPDAVDTLDEALRRWAIGSWVGLCAQYLLPPGTDGFPDTYGSCWWRLWDGGDGAWRHSASIQYPVSSVRRDPRWPGWMDDFVAAAEAAFGATCSRTER